MARKTGSHSDITGPRVREAALRLFARRGYAAVSMRAIAAEVGVKAGALYLYTSGKQALLFDLMRAHMEDLLAAAAEAVPAGPPERRLDAFARFHVRYHIDRPDLVFIAYMELRSLEPANFAAIEGLRDRYEALLTGILEEGRRSGAFALGDSRVGAMAVIAMLTGVTHWYREGGRLGRAEVERAYRDMAMAAVGARVPA